MKTAICFLIPVLALMPSMASAQTSVQALICEQAFVVESYDKINALPAPAKELLEQIIATQLGTNSLRDLNYKFVQSLNELAPAVKKLGDSWNTLAPSQKEAALADLRAAIDSTFETRMFMQMIVKGVDSERVQQPLQQNLREEYVRQVIALLRLLPKELRVRPDRPPIDDSDPKEIAIAKELVHNNETGFFEIFTRNEGMAPTEFIAKLRQSPTPGMQEALQILENGTFIMMRRSEGRRDSITLTGFQNQFVTGTSAGVNNNARRDITEGMMMGLDPAEYAKLPPEMKPIYATLMVDPSGRLLNDLTNSLRYGEDLYIFRSESTQDRMTIFPNDTLGQETFQPPGRNPIPGPTWLNRMIPWSARQILASMILPSVLRGKFGVPEYVTDPAAPSKVLEKYERGYSSSLFWEAQLWGPHSLKDVAMFIFTKTPPSGRHLREMLRLGVTIFDGRSQQLRPWDHTKPDDFVPAEGQQPYGSFLRK